MELIDTFHSPAFIDCYTFVFDEIDPLTHLYTMLATSETGRNFSQWTEGHYIPGEDNSHLGERVRFADVGRPLVEHVLGRMQEGEA